MSRWVPLVIGLAVGVLLARLVMDALRAMKPAPAGPVVLVSGYLTCVLVALAVMVAWRRLASDGRAPAEPAGDASTDRPAPGSSDARPVDGAVDGDVARTDDAVERSAAKGAGDER
jgi:hypothetical protein